MALTVDDGTQPTGANAYVSTADADDYHLARSNAAWAAATDPEKEKAILDATLWLNGRAWASGTPLGLTMMWPRTGAVAPNGTIYSDATIPQQVVSACCEVAGSIISEGAEPFAVQEPEPFKISVGSVSTESNPNEPKGPRFPAANALLRGLVGASNTIRLVRA